MKQQFIDHIKRHYATYIMITNLMISLGVAAFAIIGALATQLSVPVLLCNAIVFGVLWGIGKFGNEQLEDMPKVAEFEKGYPYA
jgi:hypothetical protein